MLVYVHHIFGKIDSETRNLIVTDWLEREVYDINLKILMNEHSLHKGKFVRSRYIAKDIVILSERVIEISRTVESYDLSGLGITLKGKNRELVEYILIEGYFTSLKRISSERWNYI